jgi:hypothetical protein
MSDQIRLGNAVLISLIVHGLMLMLLTGTRRADWSEPLPALLDIDVVTMLGAAPVPQPVAEPPPVPEPAPPPEPEAVPIPLPQTQIVSPPDAGEEKAPEATRLLSDRDVTVEEQSVRRGEPPAGTDAEASPAAPRPPDRSASAPSLAALLPGASRLASEGYGERETGESAPPPEANAPRQQDLLKYGDWKSASRRPGTLDFLPDVREGDITLLNTKAEMFAPFVRRVAVRVFQNLMIFLRRDLAGASAAAGESVTIEAVMDRAGNLIALVPRERSATSSLGTDRNLERACHEGFFDRNPPRGAEAADGRIHFLLSTRVAVLGGPNGQPFGYQVRFAAGLL